MKNTIVNGILIDDNNSNILMRIISNKENSCELIKLLLKIINSVVFRYLKDFREMKNIQKLQYLAILT